MTFADQVFVFYAQLQPLGRLPAGVEWIFPFHDQQVLDHQSSFYSKYYADKHKRKFLFGINPGRLGAGITGVPFVDPVHLETHCVIKNDLQKKHELSSIFIFKMIERLGGEDLFFSKFYISSLCPLGFVKDKKNYNYYDSKELYEAVKPLMVKSMEIQLEFPCHRDKAYSLGKGKNFKFFKELNDEHGWFKEVVSLPQTRWVMQYQLKSIEKHLDDYALKLS